MSSWRWGAHTPSCITVWGFEMKEIFSWKNFCCFFGAKTIFVIVLFSFFSFAHAQSMLRIMDANGASKAAVKIETADTEAEREKGLMFRKQLAPDAGMLFIFDKPMQIKMWMKNTLIPLDIVFANWQGQITHIEKNMKPLDLNPRGPDSSDTLYAVELPAGIIDKKHILIGDLLAIPEKSR